MCKISFRTRFALVSYSAEVCNNHETMTRGNCWNVLDNPEVICMLVSKLPGSVRDRLNKKVLNIRRKFCQEPQLEDFIKVIDEETTLVNDLLFSREAVDEFSSEAENRRKRRNFKTLASIVEPTAKFKLCSFHNRGRKKPVSWEA